MTKFFQQHLPNGLLEQVPANRHRWTRARLKQGRPWITAWPPVGTEGVLETVVDVPTRHYLWVEKKFFSITPQEFEEF